MLFGCKKSDDCHCVTDTNITNVNVTSNGLFDVNIQQQFNSTKKTVTLVNSKRVSKTFNMSFKASDFDRFNVTVSNADTIALVISYNNGILYDQVNILNNVNYNFIAE